MSKKISDNDPDGAKGATEGEERDHDANAGLAGQLGHRDQDPRIKGADSDFPEPGGKVPNILASEEVVGGRWSVVSKPARTEVVKK